MNTAVINIKTEPQTKRQAQKVAQEFGISLSGLLNAYLKQLVRTKRVEFNLDETPNKHLLSIMRKAKKNWEQNKGSPIFDNAKDSIKWLEKQGI